MTNMLLTFVVFSVDILSVGVASVSPAESVWLNTAQHRTATKNAL